MPGGKMPETCIRDLEVAQDLAEREYRIRSLVEPDLENKEKIIKRVLDFFCEADLLFTETEYTVEKGISQGCSLGNFVAELSLQTSLVNDNQTLVDCILSLDEFNNLSFLKNSLNNAFCMAKYQVRTYNSAKKKGVPVYNAEIALKTVVNIFKHFGFYVEKES